MTALEAQLVTIAVNGETRAVPPSMAVGDLVGDGGGRNVAIARNGALVPRGQWHEIILEEGDRIEIVGPVRGG